MRFLLSLSSFCLVAVSSPSFATQDNGCIGILVHEHVEISVLSKRFLRAVRSSETELVQALNRGPIVLMEAPPLNHLRKIYFKIPSVDAVLQANVSVDEKRMVTQLVALQRAPKGKTLDDYMWSLFTETAPIETVKSELDAMGEDYAMSPELRSIIGLDKPRAENPRMVQPIKRGPLRGRLLIAQELYLKMVEITENLKAKDLLNVAENLVKEPQALSLADIQKLDANKLSNAEISTKWFIAPYQGGFVFFSFVENRGPVEPVQVRGATKAEYEYFLAK